MLSKSDVLDAIDLEIDYIGAAASVEEHGITLIPVNKYMLWAGCTVLAYLGREHTPPEYLHLWRIFNAASTVVLFGMSWARVRVENKKEALKEKEAKAE